MTSREVMKWKAPLWKRLHYVLLVERKRAKRLALSLKVYAGVPLVAATVFWRRPFTFRYKPWRAWVYASVMAQLRIGKSVPMAFPNNRVWDAKLRRFEDEHGEAL